MAFLAARWNRCSVVLLGGAMLMWNAAKVAGQAVSPCPSNSTLHCDNPIAAEAIWSQDPTVQCDSVTCEWQTQLLDRHNKPIHCVNLEIVQASDPVADFLEPCLLWELIYGEFQPTASPTESLSPTSSPQPSARPTAFPTGSPTGKPTSVPTRMPSK